MNISTRHFQTLSIVVFILPLNVFADSWSCRHGNDVREIHIQRETSNPVPCSIVYKKLTEGVEDQVLWTAESNPDFCEEKALEFVEKQHSWGWTCVETIQTIDDTDDNAPVEETPVEDSSQGVEGATP